MKTKRSFHFVHDAVHTYADACETEAHSERRDATMSLAGSISSESESTSTVFGAWAPDSARRRRMVISSFCLFLRCIPLFLRSVRPLSIFDKNFCFGAFRFDSAAPDLEYWTPSFCRPPAFNRRSCCLFEALWPLVLCFLFDCDSFPDAW